MGVIINDSSRLIQTQGQLDAGVAKLSQNPLPSCSPVCVVLSLRQAFPLSHDHARVTPDLTSWFRLQQERESLSPAIIQEDRQLGDMFI